MSTKYHTALDSQQPGYLERRFREIRRAQKAASAPAPKPAAAPATPAAPLPTIDPAALTAAAPAPQPVFSCQTGATVVRLMPPANEPTPYPRRDWADTLLARMARVR